MAAIQIDWNPSPRMLRQFGVIGLIAFSAFSLLAYFEVWKFAILPVRTYYVLGPLAAYCAVFASIAPSFLKPLYLGMSIAGYPIGFVISHLVLFIVYYLIFTPVGLVFKLIGRDALKRSFAPGAGSYWVRRAPPASLKRYFRQF